MCDMCQCTAVWDVRVAVCVQTLPTDCVHCHVMYLNAISDKH